MFSPDRLLSAVLATLTLLAAPATAITYLGGVNMDVACAEQHGGTFHAILIGNIANHWRCENSAGARESIDVTAYCSQTFGRGAFSSPQGGGAFDWGCFFP
ncbi:hypothetical protein R3P38DRAFT_3356935 [Favolaschia claudopus]|uniref:Secreted protein n=1 Tax=Favolaschia claudopus TaxID=2862362 RepID=A0AAW0BA16_9AGAR